jgi:hypothetical protein
MNNLLEKDLLKLEEEDKVLYKEPRKLYKNKCNINKK